jgi:hypothetical protein
VSVANPVVCPKCGYARKPTDLGPAWQCPSCGIAYNKFRTAASGTTPRPDRQPDLRQRKLATGDRDKPGSTAFLLYVAAIGVAWMVLLYTPFPRLASLKGMLLFFVVTSFLFWISAYRRKRALEDVPIATVAGAAQGYVQLMGTAESAPGSTLTGRLTGAPCVWHQYVLKEKDSEGKHVETERGSFGVPFLLRDRTGECVVDAGMAEVVCDRCQQWEEDGYLCEEWSVRVGDTVRVVGFFSTGSKEADSQLDMKTAYELAAEQRTGAAFVARYDANNDSRVDTRELAVAREAIRREEADRFELQGGVHALGPSPDGRPFIVISAEQKGVSSHYAFLAAVHLGVFFASLGVLAFLLLLPRGA